MRDLRLYQSVAERLRKRIARGALKPGDRLPGERELADEFGVSRVTVREAEIALQAMGYIQIKAGSGAYVTDGPAPESEAVPVVSALELTQARLLFESEAAALAASAIDKATVERLNELVDIMAAVHQDGDDAAQVADREFHLTIAAASGNTAVRHTIEMLWRMRTELPAVQAVHAAVCADESASERGREHREILDALRQRNPTAARDAMQGHFTRLLASMIDASEAQAAEELRAKTAENRQRFLNSIPNRGTA